MDGRTWSALALLLLITIEDASAGTSTATGTASATAPSSTWISWEAPFTGDDDRDGWTVVELGLAPGGPFDQAAVRKLPGAPEWRSDTFRGLTSDTDYYLQLTWVDPDGVSGANPQIVGPVRTPASAANAVTLGTATVEARETEIFVSLPISGDANLNSYGTVEVATDPGGPWTERCGSPSDNRLPFHPKRCRLRSLTPGTDYWVRVDIIDPDGITGTDPQVLGPITYSGRPNLAAGQPITADPGWGCCPNPAQLVDGRIQHQNWYYGFAWTGGTSGYAGGPPGWKQATIDLGIFTTVERVEMWLHDNNSPPTDWRVELSDDGASWAVAWATTDPQCRGATEQLQGTSWGYPGCSQVALFDPSNARYVRYWFDDRTLFGGLHGWAVELEVFGPLPADLTPPTDPTSIASTSHTPSAWSVLSEIAVEWSGAADTGGSGLAGYSVFFDTSPSTLPDDTVDVAHATDPHTTTSTPLGDGQEHYFHLRTCDTASNCTATVHLGPYWIDATDPVDPSAVQSTSHAVSVPSIVDSVTMTWAAGSDPLSGLDGYAFAFNASSTPACDQTKDLEETATGVSSGPLTDGSWWFHICTVDNAGNWTSTVTVGPYVIDTAPPSDPTTVESTSHTPSTWSNDAQIAVQWAGASDGAGGGLAGYSVVFDTDAATLPDATPDVAHVSDPHTATSATLADHQSHYFHLRTCDNAANCTSTVHLGPYWIDTTPPQVLRIGSVADTGDGLLSEGETTGAPITQLTATFDEEVSGADVVPAFLLLNDGGDGFQTVDCTTGVDPADNAIAIDLAGYHIPTRTASIDLNGGVPLVDGVYRLHICGSAPILDPAGNPLDGDGDGTGGDDFVRNFTLSETRPTSHPGDDRTIDVDQSIALGAFPSATGGTPPYSYDWDVSPGAHVDLSSTTEANPAMSCSTPEVLTAELVVTDANSLESQPTSAEITVICPTQRNFFNTEFFDVLVWEATQAITAEKTSIKTGADVTFRAGSWIALIDDFTVEAGAQLTLEIDPTTDCEQP